MNVNAASPSPNTVPPSTERGSDTRHSSMTQLRQLLQCAMYPRHVPGQPRIAIARTRLRAGPAGARRVNLPAFAPCSVHAAPTLLSLRDVRWTDSTNLSLWQSVNYLRSSGRVYALVSGLLNLAFYFALNAMPILPHVGPNPVGQPQPRLTFSTHPTQPFQ